MATVEEHLRRLATAVKNGNSPDLGCAALVQAGGTTQDGFSSNPGWNTELFAPTAPSAPILDDEDQRVWQYANGRLRGDYENAEKLLQRVSYDAPVHLLLKGGHKPLARIFVGRAKRNDVVIPHKSISSIHLQMEPQEDDRAVVVDCRSKNGTFLNGERLDPNASQGVQSGDILQLGCCEYVYLGEHSLRLFLKLWLAQALSSPRGGGAGLAPRAD